MTFFDKLALGCVAGGFVWWISSLDDYGIGEKLGPLLMGIGIIVWIFS